ncbi:peptidylprolyl isomerase [Candidatus Puniceispirillum sp.]|uniref:peptidylprolyl isomerase n=1 Tax=Candidatus Puniceispirillum sp. TaxID=2026719 RepID=UPI003F6A241E
MKQYSLFRIFTVSIMFIGMMVFGGLNAFANIKIVAKVDGKPITNYDVDQRVSFLKAVTNLPETENIEKQIRKDALQMLVDDALKMQAALSINPQVRQQANGPAADLINQSFASDSESGSAALRRLNLNYDAVKTKFATDLIWSGYLQDKFADKFAEINEKIELELERITADASQPQVNISEIVLAPEPNRPLAATMTLATEMVSAIKKGADFNAIAQQYSAAGTAQQGGRLGWVLLERLPEKLQTMIAPLNIGGVSDPIQLDGAVYIFKKTGDRKDGANDISQSRIWLVRAILPVNADATKPDRLEAAARLGRDVTDIRDCDAMAALHQEYGSGAAPRLDDLRLGELAPQMQNLVKKLNVGEPSEALSFSEGVASFMVCKRLKPELNLPTREDIYRGQFNRLFGSLSERYLLRLRRKASIEFID